ncbi:aldose epimerase family protein [Alkalicoccus halolimnae]|uniref:Aldose 1-epimerase n=1 Tax=Alkalicoccus halolimnae TaxID=1667239 RepID=A0A5C7FH19_9BACI|nr:aldose epimerase family protein [Alkalicoccus halolimnae]TXF86607.1 galactose mutarotase [Alkalicoccus halolimnae]
MEKKAVFQGKDVIEYTIENKNGMKLKALNYGGAITGLYPPTKEEMTNLILSYDDYGLYEMNPYYLGAIIGRTSGRTAEGLANVEGEVFELAKNDGNNHLHGGEKGFARSFFDVEAKQQDLIFRYSSPDGEDGYPGTVDLKVTYTLSDDNQLIIDYQAETDQTTPLNLTNHSYFILNGDTILDHELLLNSEFFYELKEGSLPDKMTNVNDNSHFDFQNAKLLGEVLTKNDPQLNIAGGGIDHPFLLKSGTPAAVLSHPESGRMLNVFTNDSAVVVYTGNQIKEDIKMNGRAGIKHGAVCLETQSIPDHVEDILLRPEDTYKKRTVIQYLKK